MKVLVLTTTLPAREGDGTPSFVLDLCSELSESFQITILAPRVRDSERTANLSGLDIRRFAYFPHRLESLADQAILPTLKQNPSRWLQVPFLIISMLFATLRVARSERPSVIHANWIVPAGFTAWIVNRLLGIPYVVTVHGADAFQLKGPAIAHLKRYILEHASSVVSVSSDIQRELLNQLGIRCPSVVPMGTRPLSVTSPKDRSPDDFLFVGRLVKKKGLATAIESLATVSHAHLVVIGDGPEMDSLRRLSAELEVQERVAFLGQQPRAEVAAQMSRCLALLIPSIESPDGDKDGTPVVLAEAFASGTPVIAAAIAGVTDQVRDAYNGRLFAPGDALSLATAMKTMLSDPRACYLLGENARKGFSGSPLDIRATAERYRAILTQAGLT